MGGLKGARVVITGGSSGIGLEIARRLHRSGGQPCLVSRRADVLARAVEQLGDGAWSCECDVSDEDDVARLGVVLGERWEALDGLVNNAGIAPMATLEQTEPAVWDRAFAVNVRGPYLMTRQLLRMLRQGDGPSVVNVSSTLAEKAIPGMAAYNASKAALNQLTRSLALELAPAVRVNAVMPAVVDTPIHQDRGMSREEVAKMADLHPLGRVGQAGDVADLVLFLLSQSASWMTGTVIPVDGGMMAT